MSSLRYIDRERMADGTGRWCWRITINSVLWSAGIERTHLECVGASNRAYHDMIAELPPHEIEGVTPAENAVLLDLDRLEENDLGVSDE